MKKLYILFLFLIVGTLNSNAQSLTDSLIVYYDFHGNGKDFSNNNLDATVNGPTPIADRKGNSSNAYSFDGVNDRIDLPSSSKLKPTLPISLSFWIKADDLSFAVNPIITNDYNYNKYQGITMNVSSDGPGKIVLSYGDGNGVGSGNRRTKLSDNTISKGGWHHVVGIARGSKDMDIYIDGQNAGGVYSGSGGAMAYSSEAGKIGNFASVATGSGPFFLGSLDKVAMWNRSLSSSEVQQLYAKYLSFYQPVNDKVSIFPNPSSGEISLIFSNTLYGSDYQVFDLQGVQIYGGTITSDLTRIDLGDFCPGMYILRINETAYKVFKN